MQHKPFILLALASLLGGMATAQEQFLHPRYHDRLFLTPLGVTSPLLGDVLWPYESEAPHNHLQFAQQLSRNALAHYNLGRSVALEALEQCLEEAPLMEYRNTHLLHAAAFEMSRKRYHEALTLLEEIEEKSFSVRRERPELYVRLAYALLKTDGNRQRIVSLFRDAAQTYTYWGEVAMLYMASYEMAQGNAATAKEIYHQLERNPKLRNEARIGLAAHAYYQGNYREAVAIVRDIEAVAPQWAAHRAALLQIAGNAYFRMGDAANALHYLGRMQQHAAEEMQPEDYLLLGAAYMEQKEYLQAIAPLKEASQTEGYTSYAANLYLGRAYQEAGDLAKAIIAYEKAYAPHAPYAIREVAMYEAALTLRASGQSNFGQDVRLAESFLNTFAQSPYVATIEQLLYDFYLSNTDYETSLNSILRLKKPSARLYEAKQYVLNHCALKYKEKDLISEALGYVEQALKVPHATPLYRGESLLIQSDIYRAQGNYAATIYPLTTYLKLPTAVTPRENRSKAHYFLGYAYYQTRRWQEAKKEFRTFLADDSTPTALQADGYARLGDCYYITSRFEEAYTAYQKAHTIAPNSSKETILKMAEIQGIRKAYPQQIALLEELIALAPQSSVAATASYQKGRAYQLQGNYSQAESIYKQTAKTYAQTEQGRQALLQLALLYYNTQRTTEAVDTYAVLMHRYPKSNEAATAFAHLKSIATEEGITPQLQQIVAETGGNFTLTASETRGLEFDAAQSAYQRQDPSAPERLRNFIAHYQTGADVLRAEVYAADVAWRTGAVEEAYSQYKKVYRDLDQLDLSLQCIVLSRLGKMQEAKGEYEALYLSQYKLFARATDMGDRREAAEKAAQAALQNAQAGLALQVTSEALSLLGDVDSEGLQLQRAKALQALGKRGEALKQLRPLITQRELAAGAEAMVCYTALLAQGNKADQKQAEQLLNKFIEQGTPHEYWLARAILQLAELYRRMGDEVTAQQYVESLAKNYPQRPDDIAQRIQSFSKQH